MQAVQGSVQMLKSTSNKNTSEGNRCTLAGTNVPTFQ